MEKIKIEIVITKTRIFVLFLVVLAAVVSASVLIKKASAGTLTCTVGTSCANVTVFKMQNTTNAHAELASQSNYSQLVCCSGVTGLGNSCSGTYAVVGTLSGATNAHLEQNNQSNYSSSNDVCLSVTSGTVSVGYQADNCSGYDTTVASMSGTPTNAHVGNASAYTNKICASAAEPSLTFIVTTDNFPAIDPLAGSVFATSTLSVETDNSIGWNVTLYANNQGSGSASTTMYLQGPNYNINITDQTEWVPGAATTTAGNAVRISSFGNSQNVLAFRVMTASGSPAFISTAWWGTENSYSDNANTLWAGIASSTVQRRIGNSNVSSAGSPVLNTVLYYLDVSSVQQSGTYEGPLTFTATTN